MNATPTYSYRTRRGTFRITFRRGRWRVLFEDEDLGGYGSPSQAAYELANGHTFWPSFGDPSSLDIPEDLSDWSRCS